MFRRALQLSYVVRSSTLQGDLKEEFKVLFDVEAEDKFYH